MIGVFDSGVGGICSYRRLKELLPDEEIVYLADKENAPYGTKDEKTILSLVKRNIKLLRGMGAHKILIACCTASGVYRMLDESEQAIATPILAPAAKEAARLAGEGGRVAVISTEFTARAHLFSSEISLIDPTVTTIEIPMQILVGLVELGCKDRSLLPREARLLDKITDEIKKENVSSLILGCTHFSHLRSELSKRLGSIRVIDTARLGAEALAKEYSKNEITPNM